MEVPYDLQLYLMLRALPGYTREALEAEDDWTFEALWECIRAENSAGSARGKGGGNGPAR